MQPAVFFEINRKEDGKLKKFFKNATKKQKRQLFIRFASVLISAVLLEVVAFWTVAWFSNNQTVNGTGMQVAVAYDDYDILIDRTSVFDNASLYPYTGTVKDHLENEEGYSLSAISTSSGGKLAYELVNEDTEGGKKYLLPGAFGTLTFYLDTHGKDKIINFEIDACGLKYTYESDEAEDPNGVEEVTNNDILNYMKGHLLLFKGRTGATSDQYKYSNLITDNSFIVDTSTMEKCEKVGKTDYYEITIYWVWPTTYDDINDNTPENESDPVEQYPYELRTYIDNYPGLFFATNIGGDLEELNDGYNDADQAIGMEMDYLLVKVIGR